MSVPLWADELARIFWIKAKEPEPFPRNLRRPIARAVPLSVVLLPKLSLRAALVWLQNCGLVCQLPGEDRPLRACLAARNGHGVALIDGSDEDAEQRFSIAHELAHFLRDYWNLRRQILKRLGGSSLQVLDGERPPTSQERLHALLRNVPLGFQLHLMERDCDGNPLTLSIACKQKTMPTGWRTNCWHRQSMCSGMTGPAATRHWYEGYENFTVCLKRRHRDMLASYCLLAKPIPCFFD